jgi:hypothetical protein
VSTNNDLPSSLTLSRWRSHEAFCSGKREQKVVYSGRAERMGGGVKDAKKGYTRMLRKGCVIFLVRAAK